MCKFRRAVTRRLRITALENPKSEKHPNTFCFCRLLAGISAVCVSVVQQVVLLLD